MDKMSSQCLEARFNDLTKSMLNYYSTSSKNQNIVVSPFSLIMMLSIAADASAGPTKKEIISCLFGGMDFDQTRFFPKKLQDELKADESLLSACAVFAHENLRFRILPDYATRLEKEFGGKLQISHDLINDINAWVREKTNGMISQIADDSLKNNLVFGLLNALAFEAEWEEKYEEADVIIDSFTNADGSVSRVKMLKSNEATFFEDKIFTGFLKPYKSSKYSFAAMLPKNPDHVVSSQDISCFNLSKMQRIDDADVFVIMPEFTCDSDQDLTSLLNSLGIQNVFTDQADFSNFAGEPLKLSAVIQKSYIRVDRKGTKAATVSFGSGFAGGIPDLSKFKDVILNRPFIYAVVHTKTLLPVFAGIINKLESSSDD